MSLQQLHNDALLALITFCPDRTLIHLALTCHRLWNLAKPTLKHRQNLKRWSTISLSSTASHGPDWDHPIEVIAQFRENPFVADYVRRIEFSPSSPRSWQQDVAEEDELSKSVDDLLKSCNYLEDYIDEFSFLTAAEKSKWKQGVRKSEPNPCFLVLLSLCKRAKELMLSDPYDLPEDYFNRVIQHMRDEDSKAPGKHNETGVLGHFPAVTRLDLSHWDTEGGLSFEYCWPILRIPSLRVFDGHMLGHEYENEDLNWPANLTECKLEKISISETLIHPLAIVEWVRQLPCLKEFIYAGRYDFESGNDDLEWEDIHEYASSLKQHGEALFTDRSYGVNVEMCQHDPELPFTYEAIVVRSLESKS